MVRKATIFHVRAPRGGNEEQQRCKDPPALLSNIGRRFDNVGAGVGFASMVRKMDMIKQIPTEVVGISRQTLVLPFQVYRFRLTWSDFGAILLMRHKGKELKCIGV